MIDKTPIKNLKNKFQPREKDDKFIALKCEKCGYEKILGSKQISAFESKFGLEITGICNLNNSRFKLVHSKCGSGKISIIEKEIMESEPKNVEPCEMVHCPFDGAIHKKGTLCPNFSGHKSVTAHRRKRKYNDMYSQHRGEEIR